MATGELTAPGLNLPKKDDMAPGAARSVKVLKRRVRVWARLGDWDRLCFGAEATGERER